MTLVVLVCRLTHPLYMPSCSSFCPYCFSFSSLPALSSLVLNIVFTGYVSRRAVPCISIRLSSYPVVFLPQCLFSVFIYSFSFSREFAHSSRYVPNFFSCFSRFCFLLLSSLVPSSSYYNFSWRPSGSGCCSLLRLKNIFLVH